eukprot:SAG31_NODE_6313_length_2069_cov_2.241624_1_plen_40_part_10
MCLQWANHIISLVVECDSNNEVGGDNYRPNWEQNFSSFSE